MTIVMILLQLLLAAPSIWKVVMEIIALIKQQPTDEQQGLYAKLLDLVKRAKAQKWLSAEIAKEMEDFVESLRRK